jgi:hypothetical protein
MSKTLNKDLAGVSGSNQFRSTYLKDAEKTGVSDFISGIKNEDNHDEYAHEIGLDTRPTKQGNAGYSTMGGKPPAKGGLSSAKKAA